MAIMGKYKMGWKASIGYGGAISVSSILEVPVSRQQVCNCECLLAATVIGLHRQWFSGMYTALDKYVSVASQIADVSRGDLGLVSFELHVVRGDATNATSLRTSKVFSSDFWSGFHLPGIRNLGGEVADNFI